MTYRELLNLYKQGKLDDVRKKEVEASIEKQDAISEFLYEEGEIPEFSDLESENAENPEKVRQNVIEVALDYLACGLDPQKSSLFIQSQIPELTELSFYYMDLLPVIYKFAC